MAQKVKKESIRNLIQYKNLSDDEFDEYYENTILANIKLDNTFNDSIKDKIEELAKDYDIDDLKYNDKMQLDDLATAMVTLEYLQKVLFAENITGIDNDNIVFVDKLSRVISSIRSDVSKIQDDLKLSRKIRKSEKEENVLTYIENLRIQAKQKYEEVMSYIYCPKCKMLLGNTWFQYPEVDNSVTLVCNRVTDDGRTCGHTFTVTSKELMKNKGHNIKGIFPGT